MLLSHDPHPAKHCYHDALPIKRISWLRRLSSSYAVIKFAYRGYSTRCSAVAVRVPVDTDNDELGSAVVNLTPPSAPSEHKHNMH